MSTDLKQIILDAHLSNLKELNQEANQLGLTDKSGNLTAKGNSVARQYAQENHPEWTKK